MSFTYSPQPSWRDVLHSSHGAPIDEAATAAPWKREQEHHFWYARSTCALQDIIAWRLGAGEACIWFPDYFCQETIQPLAGDGLRIVYYPITAELSPDWDACETMAGQNKPDLFVLVHYFGFPADADRAHGFVSRHDGLLIEDAAHVLFPTGSIGTRGHFVTYSPYKLLPVPDGALLLVRPDSHPLLQGPGFQRPKTDGSPPGSRWRLKSAIQMIMPNYLHRLRTRRTSPSFGTDASTPAALGTPRMSALALRLVHGSIDGLRNIATARRAVWTVWRDVLSESGANLRVHAPLALDDETVPYRFVVDAGDYPAACRLFDALRQHGIAAESWPDLPGDVRDHSDRHAVAIRLRSTLIFLPTHQSLEPGLVRRTGQQAFGKLSGSTG